MGLNQPVHQFSGFLSYPGQVPGKSTPLSARPRLDPEIQKTLSEMPPPVTLDRMLDRPVLRAQDAVSNLGLTKALEHTLSLRIQKEAATAGNQLVFQKAINATMQESGLPPDLQGVINARAARFYRANLQKSGRQEIFSVAELAELKKSASRPAAPLKPSMSLKKDPADAKADKEAQDKANEDAGLKVEKASERYMIPQVVYPKLHRAGEKKRQKELDKNLEKAKFEETGGKYVAKVAHKGKTKYYYDEKKYKAEHGVHTTGEQARQKHIHDSVAKTVEDAGCGGCDVSSFRDLVKKFGSKAVHDSVRSHVDQGTLSFKGGRFTSAKKPKKEEKKLAKSGDFVIKENAR